MVWDMGDCVPFFPLTIDIVSYAFMPLFTGIISFYDQGIPVVCPMALYIRAQLVHREHLGSLVYSYIQSRKCVLGPQLWNLMRERTIERTVFSMQTSILLYDYLPRFHLDTSFFFFRPRKYNFQ